MRKILHNLLKGASLTTALFIFQACYGIMQPLEYGEAPMRFTLISRSTGDPLKGILVKSFTSENYSNYIELGITDEAGRCQVDIPYVRNEKGPFLHFEDPEGKMAPKDTSLADLREREILIQMVPQE